VAGDSLLEEAFQFFRSGRQAGVAGANQGAGFVFGEMRQRLAQGYRKMFERGGRVTRRTDFAEAKYFVGGTFKFIANRSPFAPVMTTCVGCSAKRMLPGHRLRRRGRDCGRRRKGRSLFLPS